MSIVSILYPFFVIQYLDKLKKFVIASNNSEYEKISDFLSSKVTYIQYDRKKERLVMTTLE